MGGMTQDTQAQGLLSEGACAQIDRELQKYPADQRQSAVMSALRIAQIEHGWLSDAVIEAVARYLGMPAVAVQEVATFYTMYNNAPTGQYKLTVCTNLPCVLRGGQTAAEYLQQKLGLGFGEISSDGLFTLKEGECMGACADAPVVLVNNHRMCSFMSEAKLDGLVAELRACLGQAE